MRRPVVLSSILVLMCAAVSVQGAPPGAYYESDQGTGLARAYCSSRMTLLGGGAFVESPRRSGFKEEKLRQTYPISDNTGVIAFGSTAIGWQAASSDFTDIVASFAICAGGELASAVGVTYESSQGVGLARAYCPAGSLVLGGGGFVETPPEVPGFQEEKLRQSYPISDVTGVIAYDTNAIGWQAASSAFTDTVVAFAVCGTPAARGTVVAQYPSAQNTGVARAFCPAGTTLTGGGGFVETPPTIDLFQEEVLRQTYPISDATGVIAYGTSAIGWQTASSNFQDDVVSIAVCVSY